MVTGEKHEKSENKFCDCSHPSRIIRPWRTHHQTLPQIGLILRLLAVKMDRNATHASIQMLPHRNPQ